VIIFQKLNLSLYDIRFLTYSRDKWCDFEEWKKLNMFTSEFKGVNDIAERGAILMEEFKDILTDDEEQRRILLHCVEDTVIHESSIQIFENPLWPRRTELIVSYHDRSHYH